ncbi:hypothetical protein SUGI_0499150 [Cryptomeria japonica]|uniref:protein CURVATURE THYLAKOID 1B, chloroplastic n=1 Tax=Cryptomeria japonica TaxID=3369 RepID=UPI002408E6A8|nr:protein CURVATURE THYLAKOID 1B, chloroplastic [Cryptomeria japonica]GLJ26025.1 hypothetical protein SUGI_0499150 [Cryptomeria japonica]
MAASLLNISVNCSTPRLDGASSVKASHNVNALTLSVKLPALPVNGASQKKCAQAQKNLYIGGHRNTKRVVVTATGESAEPGTNVDDILKSVQEVWNKVEDKYAIVGLGLTATIALWGSTGLIGAIDKLPFIPSVFELVGITYTAWFTYRNLLFKPDREALLKKIQENFDQITGSK